MGSESLIPYGHDLISQDLDCGTSYYHYDGLGSTRALSDAGGSLTDSYDYEAFGELLSQGGSTENSYLFTGEQFDQSLDHYYLRARYYDQSIGRFTQQDTWSGQSQRPITLHKYLYAGNDPVLMVDPSGNAFTIGGFTVSNNMMAVLAASSNASYSIGQKFAGSADWSDDDWLAPNVAGWLVLAAMVGTQSSLLDLVSSKINEEDSTEYELFHGTDMQSGLALVNGAHLEMQSLRNWPASNGGFYLATHYGDAVHHANVTQFGQRDDPAVVKYTFKASAYRTIRAISTVQPIPAGSRYRPLARKFHQTG
jgi:RHS repeat-associated protein